MDNREIHRSLSNPLISMGPNSVRHVKPMTMELLRSSLFNSRTLILTIFLVLSLIATYFGAVYTYAHTPGFRALPDVLADVWPTFGLLRSRALMGKLVLSSLVTCVLLVLSVIYTYRCFTVCKIRKFVFLLSVSLCFRVICNVSTQLPPPCTGFPDCKCGMTPYSHVAGDKGVIGMALVYLGTFGFGTRNVPVCGELMMSGDIMFQALLGVYLLETLEMLMDKQKYWAVKFTVYAMIGLSSMYVVIIRSEYTISVSVSLVFVWMIVKLYRAAEIMKDLSFGPFLTTRCGRIFAWLDDERDVIEEAEESSSSSATM